MTSIVSLCKTILHRSLRAMGHRKPARHTVRLNLEVFEDRIVPTAMSLIDNVTISGGVSVMGGQEVVEGQTLVVTFDIVNTDDGVTADPASPVPTGEATVSFSTSSDGGMGSFSVGTAPVVDIGGDVGQATIVTSVLPTFAYTYYMSLSYSGDSNYASASDSDAATITMTDPAAGTPPDLAPTSLLGALPLASGNSIADQDVSPTGVSYATGAATVTRTDLTSNGFGTPWGVGWSYSSSGDYADGLSGTDANQTQAPYLVSINSASTIAVVAGTNTYFFDYYSGSFHSRFGIDASLTHDTDDDEYIMTMAGNTYTFQDFTTGSTAAPGSLLSIADAYGDVAQAIDWNSSGEVTEVEQTVGSGSSEQKQLFVSTYTDSGLLASVTQETQIGSGTPTTVETVNYTYYGSDDANGESGQLELALVTDASDNLMSAGYYRYYVSSGGGGGLGGLGEGGGGGMGGGGMGGSEPAGALEYVVNTAGYEGLVATYGSDIDSVSNDDLTPFASEAFAYYSSGQVEYAGMAGQGDGAASLGTNCYSYTYTTNYSATMLDPNVWATETVEKLPGSSTTLDEDSNTVFANAMGQPLLTIYTDGTSDDQWITAYQYNAEDQLVLEASPSAVTGYDTSDGDLVGWSGSSATYISSDSGLITTYEYGSSTTATSSTAGNVANYLEQTAIQQGTGGSSVPQATYTYISNTADSVTIYKVASVTVYSNSDGTGAETTSYAYTFYSDTNAVYSATTTLPVISTDDNGSGSANTTETVFSQFGNPVWTMDADGIIGFTQYDTFTGAVTETITDVNTSDTGDFTGLPSGWSTISGAGLNLETTYQVDSLGRDTEMVSPDGNETFWVYDDALMETREYDGWDSSTDTATGPTKVTIINLAGGYIDTFTMTATPAASDGVPTGTESIADIQSLTRDWGNIAGQETEQDRYFNLAGLSYGTTMGTSGVNYYATLYGYDGAGNQNTVTSPQGTIYLTNYDGQHRKISTYVGTNDSTMGGNMVETESFEYDNGGVGDGNLTQTIQYPDGTTGERVTDYWYNWRDELVAEKNGVSEDEDDGVNRPLTVYSYDNLGEVIETQVYNGDGVTPSIDDGVLSLPDGTSSDLQAQTITSYDSQGQVWQTQEYSVNPTDGDVSDTALTTNYYYDPDGNVIATSAPGGLWTKDVYNGADEVVEEYQTDGGSGTTYSEASTVSSDVVLTQTYYVYNGDGEVTETITSDRFSTDSTTATGALGTPTSGVEARVYYSGNYYDAEDRLVASVNVGTNGSSSWDMPDSPPSRSADALVTTYTYAADAVQDVSLSGTVTGGTFTLTFDGDTTSAIAYNASASTVQSDLAALGDIGSGNVVVTTALGGGWEIRFAGTLAGEYQNQLTGDGTDLDGMMTGIAIDTVSLGGDAGNVSDTVDPDDIDDRSYYNPLGQVVQSVQDFTNGAITDGSNKTIDYTYNSIGMTSLTAEVGSGNGETTEWVYGVTTGSGSAIDSNDIVSATYQPNPSTGEPDSSISTSVTVDALSEVLTSTDPTGTTHTYDYDVLGQLVADEVTTLGSGVDGSVMEIGTTYTTLGNPQYITTYSTVDSPGDIVNQVEDVYNGLDQLIQEYQSVSGAVGDDTPYVEYNYTDLSGSVNNSRLTSIVYPDGYTVNYNYNSGLDSDISRLSYISDFTGTLQNYQYLGLDTIVVMAEPQADIELTYLTIDDGTGDAGDEYTGLDRFGRVAEQNWYNTSTSTSIVDIQYGYDNDGNVLFENNMLESTQSELFSYDGLGQLISYKQGTLSDDNTEVASPSISETWGYDPLGNHLTDTFNSTTVTSTFNYDNQITSITSSTTPTYDADGNMTEDQNGLTYIYNAWGQEVDVYSGETLEELYSYDGRGFRMTNTVGSTTTNFLNSSAGQVLEEQAESTGYYTTRYVWSPVYVNSMISRDTDTSGTGLTASGSSYARVWPVADADFNTVALVVMSGDSATVEERYAYDPFGTVTYMTASYGGESSSAYGWVYLFQGGRLDPVSGDTNFGSRSEEPSLCVWMSDDTTGFRGDDVVLNAFENDDPTDTIDPDGFNAVRDTFGGVETIQPIDRTGIGPDYPAWYLGGTIYVSPTIGLGNPLNHLGTFWYIDPTGNIVQGKYGCTNGTYYFYDWNPMVIAPAPLNPWTPIDPNNDNPLHLPNLTPYGGSSGSGWNSPIMPGQLGTHSKLHHFITPLNLGNHLYKYQLNVKLVEIPYQSLVP